MNNESGRSLIEVIGVMAIVGIMSVGTLGAYNAFRANQVRTIANAELEQIAQNTKILLEARGSYAGVSVDYLVKSGAIKTNVAPLGGDDWSVTPSFDGTYFSINLVGLTNGECNYFVSKQPTWASEILVNGFDSLSGDNCFDSGTNEISFIVE